MTKAITLIMAMIGALLTVACAPSIQFTENPPEARSGIIQANDGPDIVLDEGEREWTIWASINTADDHGISVDKVKGGDKLTIEAISGVGYFTGQSGWWKVLSVIYKVSGTFASAGSTAENVLKALSGETLPREGKDDDVDGKSKPRDGYGRNLNDGGKFAKEEGGIAVCMPTASGPMYAHGGNHFENGSGRSTENLKEGSEMKENCFFPSRARGTIDLNGNGVLYIYAFDKNYRDNAGTYELKFRIERP